MPGYGLPEGTRGLLRWGWAEQRLKKSHNYWISTVRPDGTPHTMIVWGLWLNRQFYFSTGARSRKAQNLARQRGCVICTEHASAAVIVEGTARLIREKAVLKRFAGLYQKKYRWDMSNSVDPVYAVRPRVAFGLYEKEFMASATRWKFRST
jgi:hypothetical protein